jgi:hypothetical protein
MTDVGLLTGSETGQWVLDETPRAMCCKVKVYHTPNFTKCDYALRYCNASSTVVYGSPLPASVAAQIQSWTVSFQYHQLVRIHNTLFCFRNANFVC